MTHGNARCRKFRRYNESGILAVSSTTPTLVVKDRQIAIRDMMKITPSADHRALDGSKGTKFVNSVKMKLSKDYRSPGRDNA